MISDFERMSTQEYVGSYGGHSYHPESTGTDYSSGYNIDGKATPARLGRLRGSCGSLLKEGSRDCADTSVCAIPSPPLPSPLPPPPPAGVAVRRRRSSEEGRRQPPPPVPLHAAAAAPSSLSVLLSLFCEGPMDTYLYRSRSVKQPGIKQALKGVKATAKAAKGAIKGVPTHTTESPYFQSMLDAIAEAGPGLKAPTRKWRDIR
ncbi:hypothetical protein Taro_048895 [Colocasia esculenta]|uniref:Uncharacterized protein n=1 Tax=Colocasia esculenta TaxID=4460 RepID=A0A843X9F1_COLES|nr:hypothetical protein [Colocasia esculenta]